MDTTMRHIYLIRNKKTKKITFRNKNEACFYEWNEGLGFKKGEQQFLSFDTNEELLFFYPWEKLNVDLDILEIIVKTVKEFNKVGCPISVEEIFYTGQYKHNKLSVYKNSKLFQFTIDFKKCKTHQMTVFVTHLTRFLWDERGPLFLKNLWEYKEKQKCTFWQAFAVVHKYRICNSTSHQIYYPYVLFRTFTQKEVKDNIKKLKQQYIINIHKMNFVFNPFIKNTMHCEYTSLTTTIKEFKSWK